MFEQLSNQIYCGLTTVKEASQENTTYALGDNTTTSATEEEAIEVIKTANQFESTLLRFRADAVSRRKALEVRIS